MKKLLVIALVFSPACSSAQGDDGPPSLQDDAGGVDDGLAEAGPYTEASAMAVPRETSTPDVGAVQDARTILPAEASVANICSVGYVTTATSPTQCGYWWGWRGCCAVNPALPDDPCAACTIGASNGCQGGSASYLLCPSACTTPRTGCNVAAALGLETDYCCR